jgi:hypothetical protein
MTETLLEIPFSLDEDQLLVETFIDPASADADDLREMIALARAVGRPKAAYRLCYIGRRDGARVEIGDAAFQSRTLARNLEGLERVFAHVATCGRELDEAFEGRGDILREYCWDLIKTHLLAAANEHLNRHLRDKFRLANTAAMHPGSGDASIWPIEQQRELFELLGELAPALGVGLTDSFLMIPNKTISGLIFESGKDYRSCQVCHRENCPSRRAEFKQELWNAIQHD